MARVRNNQVKFFLTDEELKKLNSKVEKSKQNKSEYLRKRALEKEVLVIDGLKELALEVSRIGNNINQLTKAIHTGRATDTGSLEKLELEYKKVFDEIYRISKRVK